MPEKASLLDNKDVSVWLCGEENKGWLNVFFFFLDSPIFPYRKTGILKGHFFGGKKAL